MAELWRELGDVPLATYEAEFRRRGSPLLPVAGALHAAVKGNSLLFLIHLGLESEYALTGIARAHPEWHNAVGTRPRGGDGYQRFASWVDNAKEWRARIHDPAYAYAPTRTLAEYLHVYSPNGDGHNNEAEYLAFARDYIRRFGARRGGPVNGGGSGGANVVITMGHRSAGDDGDPRERARTATLAIAYRDALRAAGHQATIIQEVDGDADPTMVLAGGLDKVGRLTAEWMAKQVGDNLLLLDCHLAAADEGHGIFGIIPHQAGLRTAIAAGYNPADTWENNPKDRRLVSEFVARASAKTGIPIRSCRERGLMDETQTGVAGQYNARLAMFAYTAPYQARAVRTVIEHGALDTDAKWNEAPDFPAKCAQAMVEAVNAVFGVPAVKPAPLPDPPGQPNPAYAPKHPFATPYKDEVAGGSVYLACERALTARAEVVPREWADPQAEQNDPTLKVGANVQTSHAVVGADGKQWVVDTLGRRLPASGFYAI